METRGPVRLVLIGLGMATRPHLDALSDPGCGAEVAGIYNRSRARSETVAQACGYRIFDSLEEIAKDPSVEAVIIATPPDQRTEIVGMMAKAGKHVLMEKPVERTVSAAQALVEICERHTVHLGIVLQHRFRAGSRRLRTLVETGALGEIGLVRVEVPWWRGQDYYDQPGRGTYARDGGGVLISQAIHTLDLMLHLAGPVAFVQALCATTSLHRMEAEDFATAGVRFASGAVVRSWRRRRATRVRLNRSRSMARLPRRCSRRGGLKSTGATGGGRRPANRRRPEAAPIRWRFPATGTRH